MPSEFKGTNISISKLEIVGASEVTVLGAEVQFRDSEGVVHAVTKHRFSFGPAEKDTPIYNATKTLVELVARQVATMHFNDAEMPTTKDVTHGIAEALRGVSDTAGDPGEQG